MNNLQSEGILKIFSMAAFIFGSINKYVIRCQTELETLGQYEPLVRHVYCPETLIQGMLWLD